MPLSNTIIQAFHRSGLTQEDIADRLGVRQPTVSDWFTGKRAPRGRNLEKLKDVLNLSNRAKRVRPKTTEKTLSGSVTLDEDAVVLIPRNGMAEAGDGYINGIHADDEDVDPYPRRELERLVQFDLGHLRSIPVVGNSMEPEIRANDRVIYVPITNFSDYGLYVFSIDDRTLVKLVQPGIGGSLEIIPLNELYAREILVPVREADTPNTYRSKDSGLIGVVRVIGKVVAYWKPA